MAIDVDPERAIVGTALTTALTEAAEGGGRLVLLLGEAGIGKTTVARHLAARARRSGVTVRWSACWSGGATVAHAPWLTLLSGLGSSARHAMDALLGSDRGDPGSAAAARLSAYGAVVGALEEATLDRPALLVVEDLHWADGGTVQLLDYVGAHLPGLPVLVVGTYRDTDVAPGSPLTRLGGGADRMSLRGLDHAGVAALLGDQLGAVRAAELADQVVGLTGGNPFLVVQVGRLLKEDTAARRVAPLPVGARDLLQQRLGSLADEDRRVVVGAGILGSPFRAIELAQMLDMAPPEIIEVLDRAAGLRIVERAPGVGVWAFAHDLFRQSALGGTSPGEIAALHRSAAAVLQEAQAEPAVIAFHMQAAGDDVADEAAGWSVRAGDRAVAAMAWEDAAGHYERALTALPGGGNHDIRADALAGLGRARLLAGDEQGAVRVFDELAALARSLGSAELLARAALGFSPDRSGFEIRLFDQRQIDLLYEAAHALADRGPRLRSPVLARLSVALSLTAADSRRLKLAEAAVTLAREAGEPAILARALAAHCDAISGPAHVERRLAEASEIIAIAEAEGDGPLELLGRRLRFVARLERGDLTGVEEDATSFARRAESIGNPLYSWYVPLWRAQFAIVAGDIERAERLIDHAQALSQTANSLNGPTLSMVLRLVACWHRGDFVAAIGIIDSITEAAPELAQHVSATGTLAWTNLLAGRTPVAAAALDRVAALGLSEQTPDAEWLPNMTNLVRTAAALQHPILADMVALLEPHAALVSFEGIGAGLYGSVARFVAIGCSALGRNDDAARYAKQALAMNRNFGGVLVADAMRTLAECLQTGGDGADAAETLHADADTAYAAVGARHMLRSAPRFEATAIVANELRREGDTWRVIYGGTSANLRNSKGLSDLALLLARPGQEIHVSELAGIPDAVVHGHGGDALDRRAIAAYRDRLAELTEEIDDADATHDIARATLARAEHDALVDQLARAIGVGGRSRPAGPEPIERMRKAVSARIRDAIRHIEVVHSPLGRHLVNAVHTGIYCSYQPEMPTLWQTQSRTRTTSR